MLRAFDHICMEKALYTFLIIFIIIIIIIINYFINGRMIILFFEFMYFIS